MSIQLQIALPPAGAATNRKTQFLFDNLVALINSNFVATTATGATNRLAYYTAATAIGPLSAITASSALASDANGLPVASATTAAELAFVSGVTSAIQTQLNGKASTTLNNLGTTAANADIIPSADNTRALGASATQWATIYSAVYKAGRSGLAGQIDIFPTTASKGKLSFLAAASTGDTATTITNASQAAGRTYTIPDAGTDASFVMSQGTQTVSGTKTFDGQLIGKGTATNDNAAAGYIGEYISSVTTGTVGTTATWTNCTSIILTAGDWDVTGIVDFASNGGVTTRNRIAVSVNSGTTTTDHVAGSNLDESSSFPTASDDATLKVPVYRISVNTGTTIYLKHNVAYTGTAASWSCRLSARRMR